MNHTTLALVAVLAIALAIGAFAIIESPAFAGGSHRGDSSSKTVTVQKNLQKQLISGFVSIGTQDADNCIAVLNGANACREQNNGPASGPIAEPTS
jgi:hypothetical protein